ncbi:MAG: HEAT repeat domain-containing protein [Sandaracinaceae bacterium]|nr:HEAT repeat domain-containing protein [Sandaracinaceae bacterium]
METRSQITSPSVRPPQGNVDDTNAAYTGDVGKTRREPVHVADPRGGSRSVEMLVAINVATDPKLREVALAGGLHRLETGEALAIPYVFHDPSARKFCVVVPDGMRHLVLRERAKVMLRLGDETGHAVPFYVQDVQTVVGPSGLSAFLRATSVAPANSDLTNREKELLAAEEALRQRLEGLEARERRLTERAEDVTRREDELATASEEAEHAQRELELREQELNSRAEMLMRRELREDVEGTAVSDEDVLADDVLEEDAEEFDAEEIDEIDEAAEFLDSAQSGVEELADEEEVAAEIDEFDAVEDVTGVGPSPLDGPIPTVVPPPGFLSDIDREMVAVPGDVVRLYARLDPDKEEAFAAGADLLIQLAMVQGYPVVMLALVDTKEERPYVRRATLDAGDREDRQILEKLQKSFMARVALYSSDGRYTRTIEVKAPREKNVGLVIEKASRMNDPKIDGATAAARALAAPPPVREQGHPFGEGAAASNAKAALSALARAATWATAEKLDRAYYALSVPRDVVDETFRRICGDGLKFGLSFTPALREKVLTLGLAKDPSELVAKQISAFKKTTSEAARGGLSKEEIAGVWEALLADATQAEVAIDTATHELAWTAIRAVKGDEGGKDAGKPFDLSKLADMSPPELVLLLDDPRGRWHAAVELCKRNDTDYVGAIGKAARKMPRAEVVRVVPKMVSFGEAAGDALIDALSARKTFVRQAAVLALGHIKLRRAVSPLIHLLQSEESDVWKEVARVLGELGVASFKPLLKAAKEPKGNEDRFIVALAHASTNGSRKQLQAIANDKSEGPLVARLAEQAVIKEDDAKRQADDVRADSTYAGSESVKLFSRRFYQELAGTAPKDDLDGGREDTSS